VFSVSEGSTVAWLPSMVVERWLTLKLFDEDAPCEENSCQE
jgi:hypothetical protein